MKAAVEMGKHVANLGNIAKIPRGEGRVFQVGPAWIAVFHIRDGGVSLRSPLARTRAARSRMVSWERKRLFARCIVFFSIWQRENRSAISCSRLQTYPAALDDEREVLVGVDDATAAGN